MAWNKERSIDRIEARDFASNEVRITTLSRERDFENIGPKEAVEAHGVHFYADFGAFREAIDEAGEDQVSQKKVLRALNVLAKMADEITCRGDVSAIIQIQGARTHGLTFKPYNDEAQRTLGAVLTAFDFSSYAPIFNQVFEKEIGLPFHCEVGLESGSTYIVNVGKRGSRELLSLGGPASIAAKNVGVSDSVTISDKMHGHLPAALKNLFSKEDRGGRTVFVARNVRWSNLEDTRKKLGHSFREETLLKKTEEYKAEYNLADIDVSRPVEKIDFEKLSSRIVKRQDAVSLYADLDGFTNLMNGIKTDDDAKEMVRMFSGIRAELEEVLTIDFDPGVKVQQRGDCILANFHVPSNAGDDSNRTELALEAAVGLMSSMVELNNYFKPQTKLRLQIGGASGKMFLSRIGKKGLKSPAVVGNAEDLSESLQSDADAGEIRICKRTYNRLPEGTLKSAFTKVKGEECYGAQGLTQERLIALEDEELERGAWEKRANSSSVRPGVVGVSVSAKLGPLHVNTVPHYSDSKK